MLQDPENPSTEWSEEVIASNLKEAEKQCQFIANAGELTEVLNVTQRTKTPNKRGKYRFICWFKSEVNYDDSDNPRN